MDAKQVVDAFHTLFYDRGYSQAQTWRNIRWLGVAMEKMPFDLWVYQEILHELRPDFILECGTLMGGSALYLASLCDLIGAGRIVTVDIKDRPGRPVHPRIEYVLGSSTDEAIVSRVKAKIRPGEKTLVVLDSDHGRDHVLAEMRHYAPLVSVGSYLIVEDGNVNGHPVFRAHGPGPAEAIEIFMKENQSFEVDRSREKFLLTFNPGGYLKRVRP